jgi:hypothetical protein
MAIIEKAMIRAILIAARVPRRDLEWMTESCPSVEEARASYPRQHRVYHCDPRPGDSRRGISAELSGDEYRDVKNARDRLLAARRDGGDTGEAFAALATAIAIHQDVLDLECRAIKLAPLPASVARAIDEAP